MIRCCSTWEALRGELTDQQLIELLVLAGWYRAIAYLCSALRLDPEPWARPWPGG